MEHRETEVLTNRYDFTEEEKNDMGRELAAQEMKVQRIKDEKKVASDKFKERIKETNNEIDNLSDHVHHGFEMRSYTCRVEQDWANKMLIFRDVNTENVIERRPMKGNELQQNLGY